MKLRDEASTTVSVDYDEYLKFVSAVTSKESSDYDAFVSRFAELKDQVNLNRQNLQKCPKIQNVFRR